MKQEQKRLTTVKQMMNLLEADSQMGTASFGEEKLVSTGGDE